MGQRGCFYPYLYILHILDCLGHDMQVLYMGRAPRTKETLPDFLKWHRVTRPLLVFRGLTGVTPPISVRPDWRIRTGFGVRNHILGLLIYLFIFFRADLISVVYK